MSYVKIKFPCGLEIEAKGLTLNFNDDEISKKGCPIHGKNCPPEINKNKYKEKRK